jgi:hypothetical protein
LDYSENPGSCAFAAAAKSERSIRRVDKSGASRYGNPRYFLTAIKSLGRD